MEIHLVKLLKIKKEQKIKKKVAEYLQEAAKHHIESAKHHEAGDDEKVAFSTIKAQGHLSLASEALREDLKHHALNN